MAPTPPERAIGRQPCSAALVDAGGPCQRTSYTDCSEAEHCLPAPSVKVIQAVASFQVPCVPSCTRHVCSCAPLTSGLLIAAPLASVVVRGLAPDEAMKMTSDLP